MIRLTFLLALLAIAVVIVLPFRLNGATAILFSFVGMPALGLALLLYAVFRWREGAFRANATEPPKG